MKMAYLIILTKVSMMLSLFIFVFVFCFPSMVLSESFNSIHLPPTATGPESIAFEFGTGRFYIGVADGRILRHNGPLGSFRDFGYFGYTNPNRS